VVPGVVFRALGSLAGGIETSLAGLRTKFALLDVQIAQVSDARLLTRVGAVRKRHIELRLPSGWTYRAGDYLAVLPLNSPQVVQRVLNRFKLPWDATLTIRPETSTSLPTGKMLGIHNVLAGMVELGQPVTSRVMTAVAKSIADEKIRHELEDRVEKENFQKLNVTLIDVLEDYPAPSFTFGNSSQRCRQCVCDSTVFRRLHWMMHPSAPSHTAYWMLHREADARMLATWALAVRSWNALTLETSCRSVCVPAGVASTCHRMTRYPSSWRVQGLVLRHSEGSSLNERSRRSQAPRWVLPCSFMDSMLQMRTICIEICLMHGSSRELSAYAARSHTRRTHLKGADLYRIASGTTEKT
jgi:hypothetical protein